MAKGYSRREFVKTFVVTAGAVVAAGPLLDACSDDKATPGGTPDAPGAKDAPGTSPDAGPPPNFFPQSVASGDPRTDSIILWTRVAPTTAGDVDLTIELATDDQFTNKVTVTPATVTAATAADNTVRVKVTGLTAGTRYFYRFRAASLSAVSHTGRFKTAAAASADVPVKFALLSCQDYVGKFYNTLTELLDAANDDMDFVLFIGDYVYETTGNPQFQGGAASRAVVFSDTAGAIRMGTDEAPFYAAKSLSNYRDLYKTYRGDATLQKVHEKFPFVVIWDDHEFSDDCWQDVGTYTNGAQDEKDTARRKNSEQAFFEYQPVNLDSETGTGALTLTQDQLFPNTKLYRDLRFGKHVHILLTDYRSFRPDHPVKEEGWPGTIVMDQDQTTAAIADTSSAVKLTDLPQYVNIDDDMWADQKAAAEAALMAQYIAAKASSDRAATLTAAAIRGNVDVAVLNALFTGTSTTPIPTDGLPHGISNAAMGKTSLFTLLGARYLVNKDRFDLYAHFRSTQASTPDDPYGTVQSGWLDERLAANPDATWKFLVDSVSMTSLIVPVPGGLPLASGSYYLDCDGWDGFPVRRQTVFSKLRAQNAIVLSGDIHAAYVTDYGADEDGNRIVEFTGAGVSSGPFAQLLQSTADAVPGLMGNPLVALLIANIDSLLKSAFPSIKDASSNVNGVVVLEVSSTQVKTTYSLLPPTEVTTDSTADATLKTRFLRNVYTVDKVSGKNGPLVKASS